MQKKIINAFTIIELLVVVTIIGIFATIAYPNVIKWITDREVKNEAYKTVSFINEIKAKVSAGEYGMIQILLKPNLEIYTMSTENYFNTYKSISANNTYKSNNSCSYGTMQKGFQKNRDLETISFPLIGKDNIVYTYPSAAHNPVATVLCITKDGLLNYSRLKKMERDPETNKNVLLFVFCSKSNTTQGSCRNTAKEDNMYKITIDRFVNTKIYKLVKKRTWKKIDG